jgi:hypothetical protein
MSDSKLLRAAKEAGLDAEAAEAVLETRAEPGPRNADYRFFLAILSALPWIGVLITAISGRWAESDQARTNDFLRSWMASFEARLRLVEGVSRQMADVINRAGPHAQRRLSDESYLSLVRQGFRVWDKAEVEENRELIRRVLTNAACDSHCDDSLVRRFIEWIDYYNELHFKVVRRLYQLPGSTRFDLWLSIYPRAVREDSAEADLFKLLIRDLSTGGVIRQQRETDAFGNYLKKPRARPARSPTTKSAFDDEEPYVLTALGQDFVHYALNEVVPKLERGAP